MLAFETGISVIVCCYNSANRLPATLTYLANQIVPNEISWEVIIVDNNSSDDTSTVASNSWSRDDVNLTLVFEERQGLSFAREKGINTARYEYLLFCDDDNWLDKNYLFNGYKIIQTNSKIGALGGWGTAVFESAPPDWFQAIQHKYAVGKPIPKTGYVNSVAQMIYGAGMVTRKSLFLKLKAAGFQFQLTGRKGKKISSGEDVEYFLALMKVGYTIYFDERLHFQHFMPKNRVTLEKHKALLKNGVQSMLPISAYVHSVKNYPNSFLFYSSWVLKYGLVNCVQALFQWLAGDRATAQNQFQFFRILRSNWRTYRDLRKVIATWSKEFLDE